MEAKTKYDIKDNVWLINENKAVRMFVTGLVVTFTESDNHDVKYDLNYTLCEIPENKLFKTKEELLESL
jgi:hypothetical protein